MRKQTKEAKITCLGPEARKELDVPGGGEKEGCWEDAEESCRKGVVLAPGPVFLTTTLYCAGSVPQCWSPETHRTFTMNYFSIFLSFFLRRQLSPSYFAVLK